MGYFSEQQIIPPEKDKDQSYYGFEEQLIWRYDDLKERYFELLDMDAPRSGDDLFTPDDYRYAPIRCFKTLRDVWCAMEIAKEDLEIKCGITVPEDKGSPAKEEITISSLDFAPKLHIDTQFNWVSFFAQDYIYCHIILTLTKKCNIIFKNQQDTKRRYLWEPRYAMNYTNYLIVCNVIHLKQ